MLSMNVKRDTSQADMAAPVPAPVPAPVCVACNSSGCPKDTFVAFRLPQGLAAFRTLPCEPPPELGVDGSWLPVTHVGGPNRGPTDSGGLWFYYTRGCSDLFWHMGRTMLSRNRIHAAVLAEQKTTELVEGKKISDREAVNLVAAYVRRRHPRWPPLSVARRWLGTNASIEAIIAEGARGLYGSCKGAAFTPEGALRPCACVGNATRAARHRRQLSLGPLAGDKLLSLHSEPLFRRLPLDTVTLHQQPQGGGRVQWTSEIWDLRGSPALSRHLENASAHPEVVARSRWARDLEAHGPLGESTAACACVPAPTWHTCMSCRGSALEPHCVGTAQYYENVDARRRKRGAGRS